MRVVSTSLLPLLQKGELGEGRRDHKEPGEANGRKRNGEDAVNEEERGGTPCRKLSRDCADDEEEEEEVTA